ncbi:glycerophosphodiester phosphodiesterase [Ramlibacter sp.]|uniref:glycerophosphodiester phosphodiesterase n=1 Tax=Ramlibacter sp. TaxID=1917967 RepID=UPI002C466B1C|nr:glycerophosphodiester phosphodiesterase [Ramlibacter sp.]HWI83869.1 glycerophosphodiester phosphodiesterase [Ramlibacter sp.]
MKHWPYPRWVAHRGAGKLAPENTMAAFRLGADHGYRMFECDAKLSADGVPFLMHDATLERTTNSAQVLGAGPHIGGEQPWSLLSQLDAGGWHSRPYAGEPLATLENLARFCLRSDYFLNIEIKPTPGLEQRTGEVVAREAARLWAGRPVPPLLTSFRPESLAGAQAAAPQLPRGLLLDSLWNGWFDVARQLDCSAIVCNYALWTPETVAQVHGAGMRCLSYTVNDEWVAQRLWQLGTDAIITDRLDLFSPAA